MNLQNMSIAQLKELEQNIEKAIKAKASELSIFEEQAQIDEFYKKIKEIEEQKDSYIATTKHTKAIDELGYSVIFYAKNELGIINYSKPKNNKNKYYGFVLSKDGLVANHDDVTNEDINAIKGILGLS